MALFGKRLTLSGHEIRTDPASRVAEFEADDGNPANPASVLTPGRGDFDLNNVLKLIPGEVVAPFIAAVGLPITDIGGIPWGVVVFVVCLLACVIVRGQATKPVGAPPGLGVVNVPLVLVSAIAFFFWAHAVDERGPIIDRSWFHGIPATMSPTVIWGFFATVFGIIAP